MAWRAGLAGDCRGRSDAAAQQLLEPDRRSRCFWITARRAARVAGGDGQGWGRVCTRFLFAGAAAVAAGAAGPPPADPDWPCVQRLVPTLTANTIWPGHDAAGDWRADPQVAAVVADAAPRSRPVPDAVARLDAFAAALPADKRPASLSLLFAGLVDETNRQRGQVIDSLHGIARRQRSLTEVTGRVTAEVRAMPADTSAAVRDEAVQRRAFLIREYEEIGRTIRYACEVPAALEARLGSFAQALQRDLPQ